MDMIFKRGGRGLPLRVFSGVSIGILKRPNSPEKKFLHSELLIREENFSKHQGGDVYSA
jgi:hypothetical protein